MKLKGQEIDERLLKLPGWQYVDGAIKKEYKLKDFQEAMAFVVKIALAAEKMDHHPDITIEYNRVKINLTTYSEEGVTVKDFNLAEKIEKFIGA
ncbi:MAG: 4a-hydroxytetrahydrobiopterin dehydratase [Bacteroidetes bacterium]|nr:4a-hydroxytetrahydrobiopterin dehydratase [Bacteroidota bacterium]MCL5737924.1 4a-hydroxytetrahydrobiopterin dehydratase [Bacteroidota bacterium]